MFYIKNKQKNFFFVSFANFFFIFKSSGHNFLNIATFPENLR